MKHLDIIKALVPNGHRDRWLRLALMYDAKFRIKLKLNLTFVVLKKNYDFKHFKAIYYIEQERRYLCVALYDEDISSVSSNCLKFERNGDSEYVEEEDGRFSALNSDAFYYRF